MKHSITAYGKTAWRIMLLMTVAVIGFGGCAWRSKKTITSVETMSLTLRGMRGGSVYEYADGELRLYREVFAGEGTTLELESRMVCDAQRMAELMNTCAVMRWDGFHGEHPKNVQDGIMFRFEASVNDGQTVHADGSANFPKGYHEFVRGLNRMLADESAEK